MRIYRDYKSRLHRSRISLTAVVFATFGGVPAKEVIRHAANGGKASLERRPRKLAAVALANKMARRAWAMITTGETYRHSPRPV